MLLFSSSQILRGYVYDAVGIDIKGNLDLRNASSCRRDPIQTELSKGLIVSGELSFALYHMDINSGLVIRGRREDLALLGRDRGISLDQSGGYAAHGLDGQGKGRNIQKKDIACAGVSGQLAALDRGADGNALIRVQGLAGFFSGQLFYLFLSGDHTGGSAYQQNLSKLGSGDSRILQRVLDRDRRPLNQIAGQLIEFRSGKVHIQMLRSLGGSGNERKVDIGGCHRGQLLLRLLSRLL